MSFTSVLTVIFVCAKLVGVITWSWWLVLAPTILQAVVAAVLFLAVVACGGRVRIKRTR